MATADATDDGGILKGLFELEGRKKNNKIKKGRHRKKEGRGGGNR